MKFGFFGAPIQLRVIYALIASLLWFAMVGVADSLANGYGQYLNWATGAVFAALVLLPYLPNLQGTYKLRAVALLFCGVLSYWSSITLFVWLGHPGLQGAAIPMGLAGVGGALIIGIGARLIVPLVLRWRGWLLLMGAGLLGGIVLGISFPASIGAAGTIDHKYLPGALLRI
jgi:hypothetical protein